VIYLTFKTVSARAEAAFAPRRRPHVLGQRLLPLALAAERSGKDSRRETLVSVLAANVQF